MTLQQLADILRSAFRPILGGDEITIRIDTRSGQLEVGDEAWTLTINGWPDHALARLWLSPEGGAVDDFRQDAMAYEIDEALARVDAELDGTLSAVLSSSDDPLSIELAREMIRHDRRFLEQHITFPRSMG